LKQVPKSDAGIAWLIYELQLVEEENGQHKRYCLKKVDEVFTEFEPALQSISTPSYMKSSVTE